MKKQFKFTIFINLNIIIYQVFTYLDLFLPTSHQFLISHEQFFQTFLIYLHFFNLLFQDQCYYLKYL